MWVVDDGQYLGEVATWNRAMQFADGVFETIRIVNGVAPAFSYHLSRLEKGLSVLKLNLAEGSAQLLLGSYIAKMQAHSGLNDGVLKIIVARANSARGYAFDGSLDARVTAFYSPFQALDSQYYDQGINVQLCQTQCSINGQLAGLKHLNRLENVLAKNELNEHCFEGLMSNHLEHVIEGVQSNVFFEDERGLLTPDLSLSGVEGVMRAAILQYCEKNNRVVRIKNILTSDINQYQHAFMSNSLFGVLPVKTINGSSKNVGKLTRTLMQAVSSGKIYE